MANELKADVYRMSILRKGVDGCETKFDVLMNLHNGVYELQIDKTVVVYSYDKPVGTYQYECDTLKGAFKFLRKELKRFGKYVEPLGRDGNSSQKLKADVYRMSILRKGTDDAETNFDVLMNLHNGVYELQIDVSVIVEIDLGSGLNKYQKNFGTYRYECVTLKEAFKKLRKVLGDWSVNSQEVLKCTQE